MLWLGRGLQLGTRGKEQDAGGGSTGWCQSRGWGRRVTPAAQPHNPHGNAELAPPQRGSSRCLEPPVQAGDTPCRTLPRAPGTAPAARGSSQATGIGSRLPRTVPGPPAVPFPLCISTAPSPPAHLPRPGRDWQKVGGTGGSPVLGCARAPGCDARTAPRTREGGGGWRGGGRTPRPQWVRERAQGQRCGMGHREGQGAGEWLLQPQRAWARPVPQPRRRVPRGPLLSQP